MAQSNVLKRYLDAGMEFTATTQAKAEEIVKDLVRAGEIQAEQAQAAVTELVERSRRNTEALVELIRSELSSSADSLGFATLADLDRLEQRVEQIIDSVRSGAGTARRTGEAIAAGATPAEAVRKANRSATTAKKTTAKKSPAKKTAAKKTTAKTAPAKKTTAKKVTAKKVTAKKAPAKKTAAKKTPAKKTTAKKTAAKKSSPRSS